ncbi:septum formation inhibitor Maf [Thiomicrorhabdus sp. 6S2-11]|uniref:7-methyl-GTP pyrophosphatase n=1 Tax=Thiomicrorhabdus marina TaxID=2818442 RepID=A0ABS3Q871_9GAMM|nr:nucleoside triphosphate pyrophosphatase [Thiomicrorhabdus marina]MBO1928134.1 septum formation inhibitor Maf [Thiomicrorhabdus marina]
MQDTHGLSTSHPQLLPLVLASTSIYRQQMLEKLQIPFTTCKPEVDETPLENENVKEMVQRLSLLKAQAACKQFPAHLIIGSDQSAVLDGKPLGKPHTFEKAKAQLQSFSGKTITFYTGLAVVNSKTGASFEKMDITKVVFRELSDEVIENYLTIEQPLNCAGSFKSEGLGVTLFERIESRDPNALIGLPLMALTDIFYAIGIALPLKVE